MLKLLPISRGNEKNVKYHQLSFRITGGLKSQESTIREKLREIIIYCYYCITKIYRKFKKSHLPAHS